MSFIQKLCCVPSFGGRTTAPSVSAGHNGESHAPGAEKIKDEKQATPPDNHDQKGSSIILELSENPKRSTREIMEPHLQKEAELRKSFAKGDTGIHKFANLVPLYTGQEQYLKTRNIDRELNTDESYIMGLPEEKLRSEEELAIVSSLEDYRRNFRAFTHGE